MERLRNCLSQKFRQTLAHQTYHATVTISTVLVLTTGKKIGLVAGHLSHKFTIDETSRHFNIGGTPRPCARVRCQRDLPATRGLVGATTLSCAERGETILQCALDHNIGFPPQEMDKPSHPPYNTDLQPRRLDYIRYAVPNAIVGNCRDRVRSDHEPILASGLAGPVRKQQHISWGPRELRADCGELLQADAHTAIAAMAKTITQPASRQKFKDSRSLKELRRRAQTAPPGLTTGVRPLETGFGASQKGAQ